ncbi:hypothetical protein [Photobacterium aquae]|nr:hypothetical protein [Photobacterium aquae]
MIHALGFVLLFNLSIGKALAAFVPAPNTVQFRLEGCNNGGNIPLLPSGNTLPNTDGNFTCQDPSSLGGNDTPYTTGNLGKGWNELDLVPHRLIATNGNSSGAITYDVIIAADNADSGGVIGYDQIADVQIIQSPDTLNVFSDASCSVTVGAQSIDSSGTVTGGIDSVIYRQLTITQAANTTCVIDWANRIAIGANQFSGSSLQAYMFESEDFQQGKKTVPISVRELVAAGIRKDMTATRGGGQVWNVTKSATPSTIDLGNTCDTSTSNSAEVTIRVEWSVLPTQGDSVLVITNIFATNPSAREMAVVISDTIFGDPDGAAGGSPIAALDTVTSGEETLLPGQEKKILTHTYNAPGAVSDLSDTAVATFIDKVTGIAFDITPEVSFDLNNDGLGIQPSGQDTSTANISDTEKITGNGLSYQVDSLGGAGADGSFSNNYSLGTPLEASDPDLVWTSMTQTQAGFAEFTKTITANIATTSSGTLSDWALLTASDGSQATSGTQDNPVSIQITRSALINLDVELTVPPLVSPDTLQCTVEITNASNQIVDTLLFEFSGSENIFTKQHTSNNLDPEQHTATVTSCGGLAGETIKLADLTLPANPTSADCEDKIAFIFTTPVPEDPVLVAVDKITLPEGEENGWIMTLSGPGTGANGITLVTSDSSPGNFEYFQGANGNFELQNGTYTITESPREGWRPVSSSGCNFDVDVIRDAGTTKFCSFTNTKTGTIIIHKQTKPKYGEGFSFTHDIDPNVNPFNLDHGQYQRFDGVLPGSYNIVETDPGPDYSLANLTCSESSAINSQIDIASRQVSIELEPGELIECTYTNVKNGMVILDKLTNGYPTEDRWQFTLSGTGVNTSAFTPPNRIDFAGIKLKPYHTYTLCEVGVPYGWQPVWVVDTNNDHYADEVLFFDVRASNSPVNYRIGASQAFNPDAETQKVGEGNLRSCVNFVVKPGQALYFKVDNIQFDKPKIADKPEPNEPCYDKPVYGHYLGTETFQSQSYQLGNHTIQNCEIAKELLEKKAPSSNVEYLATKLFNAQLHQHFGLKTCHKANNAMKHAHEMLLKYRYNGQSQRWGLRDRYQASRLSHDLDLYTAQRLCP